MTAPTAADIAASAIAATAAPSDADTADAIAQMKDASQKVDGFLAAVKKLEGQLGIASAVVGLAGAALVGDAGGVLSAAAAVYTALDAAKTQSA